jgi:hypothetical protein
MAQCLQIFNQFSMVIKLFALNGSMDVSYLWKDESMEKVHFVLTPVTPHQQVSKYSSEMISFLVALYSESNRIERSSPRYSRMSSDTSRFDSRIRIGIRIGIRYSRMSSDTSRFDSRIRIGIRIGIRIPCDWILPSDHEGNLCNIFISKRNLHPRARAKNLQPMKPSFKTPVPRLSLIHASTEALIAGRLIIIGHRSSDCFDPYFTALIHDRA